MGRDAIVLIDGLDTDIATSVNKNVNNNGKVDYAELKKVLDHVELTRDAGRQPLN